MAPTPASFQNIDGVAKGSDVKLAGIKIGYVDSLLLEDETYYATIKLYINDGVYIPVDSRAVVSTNGLLGGKYIRINPGASEYQYKWQKCNFQLPVIPSKKFGN